MNENDKKIIDNAIIPFDYLNTLEEAIKESPDLFMAAVRCFSYGVAIGKRQERARRKKYNNT